MASVSVWSSVLGLDLWFAVGAEGDRNVVGVDFVVVAWAEEGQVVQAGWSALGPVVDVVCVGPGGWFFAAGEDAAVVSDDERGADVFGDDPSLAADVQGFAGGGEDDALHGGVAG